MLSQCISVASNTDIEKKTGPTKATILNNIMRQIVNKFGNLCWWAPIELCSEALAGKNVMIIGVDVHHGKKRFMEGENMYRQRRSIGGFIASIIDSNGVYRTSCGITVHKARKEIVGHRQQQQQQGEGQSGSTTTTSNTTSSGTTSSSDSEEKGPKEELGGPDSTKDNALKRFIERVCDEHNITPDVIFVYRDGVAESQLGDVKKFEYEQVRQACPNASITYFVLQKRVHSKFMIELGDQIGNPPPATVIDTDAKIVGYNDFYLIPTKNNLSTVKPVHYILIHDDGLCTMDELQQITYTMCFLYPNWTDAIKIPFVTQAAHKMAYLLGDLDIEEPQIHQNLNRTYFYL